MYNFIVNRGLKILAIFFVLIFSCSFSYSQCLNKDLVSIELNSDELIIDLSKYSGDLTAYKFRLYNYETTNDFISVNLLATNQSKFEFDISKKQIIINDIPEGEYLVIFENNACDNIYVGEGFTGFPYSGIRIE